MKLRFSVLLAAVMLPCQANGQITNVRGLPNIDYAIATANNISVVKHETLQQYEENAREDLALCAVRNTRNEVDRTLALKVDSQDYVKAISALASSKCLRPGSYSFQPSAFRAALFRELYRSEFRHHAPPALRNSARYPSDIDDPTSEFGKAYLVSRKLADCIVVADPADSRKLVLSEVGDGHEKKLFASLTSPLQNCLPAGATVSLDPYQLSEWIAEALYRESKVAPGADNGGGQH